MTFCDARWPGAAWRWLTCAALVAASGPALAQYDPRAAFAPFPMEQAVNVYRSSNGLPGPQYWQNRADYAIHATLHPDAAAPSLSGDETVTYTNNSPDTLEELWLQLDQNIYRPGSRGAFASGTPQRGTSAGIVLDKVEVERGGRFVMAPYLVSDTRMRVSLPAPLAGRGAKVRLRIAWHFAIPGPWGGRMGWMSTKDGAIYDIAQWYPRLCVYDDIRGWDTAPYLGQEFYLEYGDFDYFITAPAGMIVVGSGELVNPQDVLTTRQRERLAKARTSDSTVMIRSPEEIGQPATGANSGTMRTWHFHMAHTRDVAFAASSAFVWDAARINLPDGKSALAMSVYPAQSAGRAGWGRSTEYLKDAVENFSRRWFAYPWPAAVNVGGPVSSMEYPALAFDDFKHEGATLFLYTAHEIGHSWFPMTVGSDERRDAWMDEGFNTFIDIYQSDDFNHGEYAPKRDPEYAPGGGNPADEIVPLLADPDAPPIMTRADSIPPGYAHSISYFKTAFGLVLLREQILGPERFDPAFRRYVSAWAFKHPKPADFFRAMDSAAGEDLSYFWRGWFARNWTLDLAVDAIRAGKDGTTITLASLDRLVLPATLRVAFADGSHEDFRLPAESWIRSASTQVTIPSGKTVVSATVDPDRKLPDKDRSNDTKQAPLHGG
ncbi:MAG TPA: M1 family metallopeptidase [Croceibacterium sp.]|nr:M1 family metallopeptidase [Croceibacterium sp.]